RHTRFKCDWSSDVCSSDLVPLSARYPAAHGLEACPLSNVGGSTPPDKIEWESHEAGRPIPGFAALRPPGGHRACARIDACTSPRSEERRVGKGWRSRSAQV